MLMNQDKFGQGNLASEKSGNFIFHNLSKSFKTVIFEYGHNGLRGCMCRLKCRFVLHICLKYFCF